MIEDIEPSNFTWPSSQPSVGDAQPSVEDAQTTEPIFAKVLSRLSWPSAFKDQMTPEAACEKKIRNEYLRLKENLVFLLATDDELWGNVFAKLTEAGVEVENSLEQKYEVAQGLLLAMKAIVERRINGSTPCQDFQKVFHSFRIPSGVTFKADERFTRLWRINMQTLIEAVGKARASHTRDTFADILARVHQHLNENCPLTVVNGAKKRQYGPVCQKAIAVALRELIPFATTHANDGSDKELSELVFAMLADGSGVELVDV
jgi:hypothetical protein